MQREQDRWSVTEDTIHTVTARLGTSEKSLNHFFRQLGRDFGRIHPALYTYVIEEGEEVTHPVTYQIGAGLMYDLLLTHAYASEKYLIITSRDIDHYEERVIAAIKAEDAVLGEDEETQITMAKENRDSGYLPARAIDYYYATLASHAPEMADTITEYAKQYTKKDERRDFLFGVITVLGPALEREGQLMKSFISTPST